MKSPSLASLRKAAAARTAPHGHRLKWGQPYGHPAIPSLGVPEAYSQRGQCRCGLDVTVRQQSMFGTDGPALHSPCVLARPGQLLAL